MRLQWLAIIITLIVTLSTFGNPMLFDRLFLGLLLLTAAVSFKWDLNLFTLCLIYIAGIGIEEVAWLLTVGDKSLIYVIPAYAFLIYAAYLNVWSKLGKLSFVIALISVMAEIYWVFIDKERPEIYWYAFVCANLLVIRHLVLIRPHYCAGKFKKYYNEWQITKTDVDISYVIGLRVILEFLNLGEYLVRHVLGYSVTVIYQYYSSIAHLIFTIVFYLFLRAFVETLKTKLFSA